MVACETLAAPTPMRRADGVSICPEPLPGRPETRGLAAVTPSPLEPGDVELLLLTPRDGPLTPAAACFAHRLSTVCQSR